MQVIQERAVRPGQSAQIAFERHQAVKKIVVRAGTECVPSEKGEPRPLEREAHRQVGAAEAHLQRVGRGGLARQGAGRNHPALERRLKRYFQRARRGFGPMPLQTIEQAERQRISCGMQDGQPAGFGDLKWVRFVAEDGGGARDPPAQRQRVCLPLAQRWQLAVEDQFAAIQIARVGPNGDVPRRGAIQARILHRGRDDQSAQLHRLLEAEKAVDPLPRQHTARQRVWRLRPNGEGRFHGRQAVFGHAVSFCLLKGKFGKLIASSPKAM